MCYSFLHSTNNLRSHLSPDFVSALVCTHCSWFILLYFLSLKITHFNIAVLSSFAINHSFVTIIPHTSNFLFHLIFTCHLNVSSLSIYHHIFFPFRSCILLYLHLFVPHSSLSLIPSFPHSYLPLITHTFPHPIGPFLRSLSHFSLIPPQHLSFPPSPSSPSITSAPSSLHLITAHTRTW